MELNWSLETQIFYKKNVLLTFAIQVFKQSDLEYQ